MEYTVVVRRLATLQMASLVARWRATASQNPRLLEDELAELLSGLRTFPDRGLALPRSGPQAERRYLITRRTGYMVVYRVRPRALRVEVLAIVNARGAERPW